MTPPQIKVSSERWRKAQEWERGVWLRANRGATVRCVARLRLLAERLMGRTPGGDDRNHWWAAQFNHYNLLPREFENAIELGCGPYTNLRLILTQRTARHVFCSDPLVRDYATLHGRWLADQWQQRRVLIDDHPIEECPFASGYFDLMVMINVLDHVRDAALCVEQALRITRPGGWLVIGQDLTHPQDAGRIGDDVGHPIRLDHEWLNERLLPAIEPALHQILPREQGLNPDAHYGTYLLMGRKR